MPREGKKRIAILAGARIEDMEWLRQELAATAPEAILCADGGARYARLVGVVPDLIVGDLDSLPEELQRSFRAEGIAMAGYPARKDETDTQLALERALAMGAGEILVFGALGGRLDHTLANIGLLLLGGIRGAAVILRDESCDVFAVTGEAVIRGEAGQTVSIFPLGGDAAGIDLAGFDYPLEGAAMTMSRPYGISNRLAATTGLIRVGKGRLLVIHYRRAVA
ncbi:MAG: thiamine diphosphokinase [Pseudomonadota bacterium]|nr:thiamine diphosphokinase [Pseudomonadota bacterium]